MIKQLEIIKKNFKVLLRSKASAFVVLIGPLLIIGLISLALSNTENYTLEIGIIAPDNEGLTNQFITQLEKGDYTLTDYNTVEECIQKIKLQKTNLCIKFPPNFVLDNQKTHQVQFHVDKSRINIVESIVSSVKSTITLKSDEITLGLTDNLIKTIEYTEEEINKEKTIISEMKKQIETGNSNTNQIEKNSGELANSIVATEEHTKDINSYSLELETAVETFSTDLDQFIEDVENVEDHPATANIKKSKDTLNNASVSETDNIKKATEDIDSAVNLIVADLGENGGIIELASKVKGDLESIKNKVDEIEQSLQRSTDKINELEITSASSIINPFTIEVTPVLAISEQSTLMFPYIIILIILFVGVMLSSTLVVMEKKSRAFFRTFTTPTSEISHLIAGFVTNLIVISLQLGIIFTSAYYYLKIPVMNNYKITLLILFLTVSFFIFLGSFIGYLFKTQEGTTIASISLGSLFLFLSNIILPIETFSQTVRELLIANPFVLCSELFKKSMLFSAQIPDLKRELILLFIYVIISFILVLIFQKLSLNRLFKGLVNRKILKRPHITKDNYLRLPDGTMLKNISDLKHALKSMKDETFNMYVNKRNNEFSLWVKDVFKNRKLANKIKKAKTKERIIKVIKESNNKVEESNIVQEDNSSNKNRKKIKIKFRLVK